MTDKLITIASFSEPFQAELAKIKLNTEGIKCFLASESFVATYWLLSSAEGGVKLQVKEFDAKRALEILENKNRPDIEEGAARLTPEPINPLCPQCHSEDVEYEKFSKKLAFLSILFLRFPLPLLKKSYKCNNCGHTWKQKR